MAIFNIKSECEIFLNRTATLNGHAKWTATLAFSQDMMAWSCYSQCPRLTRQSRELSVLVETMSGRSSRKRACPPAHCTYQILMNFSLRFRISQHIINPFSQGREPRKYSTERSPVIRSRSSPTGKIGWSFMDFLCQLLENSHLASRENIVYL